jgi:hypothetical protein
MFLRKIQKKFSVTSCHVTSARPITGKASLDHLEMFYVVFYWAQ